MTQQRDTIIAQCTPSGVGAIAVLRISGPQAWDISAQIVQLPGAKQLGEQQSHTVHFARGVDVAGNVIDQVMVALMRGPRTFTGEDVVEISCHHNQYIIDHLIAHACERGARRAQAGEFARRAVLAGKIDIAQAEAINELIHAQQAHAAKRALAQLEGSLSHHLAQITQDLIMALAWCDASFEFLEDEGDFVDELRRRCDALALRLEPLLATATAQRITREGVRIALIGSVNAGKSSLLNALVGYQRAIVTPVAGTTRDTVEVTISVDALNWTIIDTAGMRDTTDIIEQEGIKRSQQAAIDSDIIVYVIDQSRPVSLEEEEALTQARARYGNRLIIVGNKADLATEVQQSVRDVFQCTITTHVDTGIAPLTHELCKKITELMKHHEAPFLLNQRQLHALQCAHQDFLQLKTLLKQPVIAYELVSYHLRNAAAHIDEVTGKTISESAFDAVFKQFCVGK